MSFDKPNLSHIATHLVSIFKPIDFWNVPQFEAASSVSRYKSRAIIVDGYLGESMIKFFIF